MFQAFLVLSCVTTYLIYNAYSNVCLCSTIVKRLQRAFTTVFPSEQSSEARRLFMHILRGVKG